MRREREHDIAMRIVDKEEKQLRLSSHLFKFGAILGERYSLHMYTYFANILYK